MRSENCLRIFSAQGESTKQRETKGGDQSKAVTNIFISLFSEVTSVQHHEDCEWWNTCNAVSESMGNDLENPRPGKRHKYV